MRFGLVGTGPWAKITHGPGLQAAAGVELVGVWGRDRGRTGALATDLGTTPYSDYAELLADVDAVAFAVPPKVQVSMALEAAAIGKHLLLDKPVADSVDDARALAEEVANEGIASVVFFTGRFEPETRAFFEQVRSTGGWKGGWTRMLASLDAPGNPFSESPWRREQRGALWDVGPHALSNLSAMLGPIAELRAVGGEGDLVHLVLTHEDGATSTASLALFAPPMRQQLRDRNLGRNRYCAAADLRGPRDRLLSAGRQRIGRGGRVRGVASGRRRLRNARGGVACLGRGAAQRRAMTLPEPEVRTRFPTAMASRLHEIAVGSLTWWKPVLPMTFA